MEKKNILVITADQLAWRALSSYGNTYTRTSNIDRIAANGMQIEAAYTPCPLCQPARTAIWTGLYPHQTKVLSNGRKHPVQPIPPDMATLGECFALAGYETVHFGKCHDAGALRGFECEPQGKLLVTGTAAWPVGNDTAHDRYTTQQAVDYLGQARDKPFFMVAELVNPHDICSWVGHNQGPHTDVPLDVPLPSLPENFAFPDLENRSRAVQYICCTHNRQAQAAGWTPLNFQHYLAAYYHYLARADQEIGLILDALARRPDAENTLVVFFADHGDSMAARGRTTKQVDLYDEVTRVPFIFQGPGIKAGQLPENVMPVSLLDLFPTLCSYAKITPPAGLAGIDLMPWLTGQKKTAGREYVVSQWHTEWGYTISPGRMIRSRNCKYIVYLEDKKEELYDLGQDPFEKINQAENPAYQEHLQVMRTMFNSYLDKTGDPFWTLEWLAPPRWRSHAPGYQNHSGPAAPMLASP